MSNLIFPKQFVKAINLIYSIMARFIIHKEWIKGNVSNDPPLLGSRYYLFAHSEPNQNFLWKCHSLEKTRSAILPLTGIPILCVLVNKLIEAHTMQKVLPHTITKAMIEELDKRYVGDSSYPISSRMMKRNEKIYKEIKTVLLSSTTEKKMKEVWKEI